MDRERHDEFMKCMGRLLQENIEAVHLLNKASNALKEKNKTVANDITRLKGILKSWIWRKRNLLMDGQRNLRSISKQYQNIKDRRRIEKEMRTHKEIRQAGTSLKEMKSYVNQRGKIQTLI